MKTESLIPRLRFRSDLRTLGFVALSLTLLAGNWSGILRHPVSVGATFFSSFVCCIIAHNHMHSRTLRSGIWNRIFQLVLMFGSGQPPTGIITAHNERHHREPETDRDFVRTSLVGFRSNFLNIVAFPFVSIAAMYREKPQDLRRWKSARPGLYRQARLERRVFYGFLIALLVVDVWATLMFLILPWLGAQLMLVGINLLQHQDCDPGSEYDHSRNVTGRLLNWFLLNNGFHTAHHLRPSLHWSLLPEFHRVQVIPQINPALDHRSLCGLLLERLRRPAPSHAR